VSTLFISDLHLSENRPHLNEAFFSFLNKQARQCETLYILGDLFDAWIGDDDDSPFALEVLDHLKAFSDTGKKLFFMAGNRDFLVGRGFTETTNAQILPDPSVIELSIAGKTSSALLMHGDSLCTEDQEYQQFRTMVRNPAWQEQVLGKSLEERRQLASMLREESQQANSEKNYEIMDVTPSEVISVMEQHQQSLLIHGHTHRPATHDLNLTTGPAQRIVLGDWEAYGWYLLANDEGLHLEKLLL